MKCLSILQPWATLILLGARRFEIRDWHTRYRGPLAIHAAQRFPPTCADLCRLEPVRSLLSRAGHENAAQLPRGVVLGTVQLVRCVRVEDLEPKTLSIHDTLLGDFRPGRWVWELARPTVLSSPLALRGRLGVFELPVPFPGE